MKQVIRHGRQEPLLPGRNEAAVEWWTRALAARNGSDRGMAEFVVDRLAAEREPLLAALRYVVDAYTSQKGEPRMSISLRQALAEATDLFPEYNASYFEGMALFDAALIEAEAAAGTALDRPVITSAELEAMTVAERTAYVHDRAVIAAAKLPQAVLNSIKAPAALDVERLARALDRAGMGVKDHQGRTVPYDELDPEWQRSRYRKAAAIAAEYARLAGEDSKDAD